MPLLRYKAYLNVINELTKIVPMVMDNTSIFFASFCNVFTKKCSLSLAVFLILHKMCKIVRCNKKGNIFPALEKTCAN